MANRSIPTQKQMTGMLGHPVAENPIDRMFDAVYAHYGLDWQFWKCDVPSEKEVGAALAGVRALGFAGACITVPYKVAAIPHLDEVDADVRAIGAVNWMTIKDRRLIGHNNDGKGVVAAIQKVTSIAGKRVAMLGAGGAGRAMAVELAWAGAAHMTIAAGYGVLIGPRGYFLIMVVVKYQVASIALPDGLSPLKTLDEYNYCTFTNHWLP